MHLNDKLNNRIYEVHVADQVMHLIRSIMLLYKHIHLENMTILNTRLQNITFYMKHTFSQTKINLHK